jgi:hypothetical protein
MTTRLQVELWQFTNLWRLAAGRVGFKVQYNWDFRGALQLWPRQTCCWLSSEARNPLCPWARRFTTALTHWSVR